MALNPPDNPDPPAPPAPPAPPQFPDPSNFNLPGFIITPAPPTPEPIDVDEPAPGNLISSLFNSIALDVIDEEDESDNGDDGSDGENGTGGDGSGGDGTGGDGSGGDGGNITSATLNGVNVNPGDIGASFGSSLGNALGHNSLEKLAFSSVIGAIGKSVGDALRYGASFSIDAVVKDGFGTVAGGNGTGALQGGAIGSVSSLLMAELGEKLGLTGFTGGLFTTTGAAAPKLERTAPFLERLP